MIVHDRAHQRPVELGPYPFEVLQRDPSRHEEEAARPATAQTPRQADSTFHATLQDYQSILLNCAQKDSAPEQAGADDLTTRTRSVKGAAFYLDADHCGICELPQHVWHGAQIASHQYGVVICVGFGRSVETNNLAHQWLAGSTWAVAHLRAVEIAVSLTGYLRALGFSANFHVSGHSEVDIDKLQVLAGVGVRHDSQVHSPFLGTEYAAVAITCNYEMLTDEPLAPTASVNPLRYWWGVNGARSGRENRRRQRRASHLSRYPMETVKRVDQPTTLIFEDEVPRVPKRAEFFMRARKGDLGAKAQQEVQRFAFKHPLTDGMMYPLRALVPYQDGEVAEQSDDQLQDAERNTVAIKSLSYHLGADLTGICRIPNYAWYSHDQHGEEIEPYHRYAVVMLIDQGYDTMEGASGDDWISGCQSMRGYIRGAEIAGVMAEFLRRKGVSARPQTNADSHVLQIPLVLLAGLGELSRIGELVLNPFVGPRFKSVVLTTNLPLIEDQPIDFGLQTFCRNCFKCARECPVNAIPFGDKVMFNGYEIWKPDVERCTRYRVTNPKGSACGRCMKTCPLNKVVDADGALVHRLGTWLSLHARWLKPLLVPLAVYLDDKLGYGKRNPHKRWWQDLEMINGIAHPARSTNERDIDPHGDCSGHKSPVGYYHAADNPPPNATDAVMANHKAAVARAAYVESVNDAQQRRAQGGNKPAHYIPTKTIDTITDKTAEQP